MWRLSSRGRRSALFATLVIGGLLTAAASAYACLAQATLKLDRSTVSQGARVTGSGKGFNGGRMNNEHGSSTRPVQIHFKRVDGRVLWSGRAGQDQKIRFAFRAPRVKPGYYTLVATQYDDQGDPVYGTPARTTLRIVRR